MLALSLQQLIFICHSYKEVIRSKAMNERFFGHDLRRPVAGTVPSAEESSRNGGACSAAPVGRDPASGGGEGFVADEVPLSGREIVLVLEPALGG